MSNTQANEENKSTPALCMDNWFQIIRLLSGIMDKECPDDDDKAYFSSNIFTVQYQMAKFNENVTHVPSTPHSQDTPNPSSSPFFEKPTRIALFIYINMVLRKIPLGAVLHRNMAKQLISTLEISSHNLCRDWAPNLRLLLWLLFVGGAATTGSAEHSYFVRKLVLVALRLRLPSFDSFINILKETAWSKDFCTLHSATLWKEMISCMLEGLKSGEDSDRKV
jgi:hypothetical protein